MMAFVAAVMVVLAASPTGSAPDDVAVVEEAGAATHALSSVPPPLPRGWGAEALDEADALIAKGALAEAEARLLVLLQREDNPLALLRLSRICRWTGRPIAAKAYAQRGAATLPGNEELRAEWALALAALGQPSAALRTVGGEAVAETEEVKAARRSAGGEAVAQTEELQAAVRSARAPRLAVSGTAYSDSNGITRFAPRASFELQLPADFRLMAAGGVSHLQASTTDALRTLLGAQLSWRIGRAELSGGWVGHFGAGTMHEGFGGALFRFTDAASLSVRVRRRPFFEAAPSLATGEESFHAAGTGGAVSLPALERRGVDELTVGVSTAPFRATYLYADGKAFAITDGNLGWSVAAGMGFDVLAATGLSQRLSLTLRFDSFLTGFAEGRRSYFSPALLDSQSPGLSAQVRLGDHVQLSGEGGVTYSLTGGQTGYFAGLGAALSIADTRVSLRAQSRDDPWFASRRAWVEITRSFP